MAIPTSIILSFNEIMQGAPVGFVIGSFTAQSSNVNDVFTYTLTNDSGGMFSILGNQLLVRDPLLIDTSSDLENQIIVMATSTLDNQSYSTTFNIITVPNLSLNAIIYRVNPIAIHELTATVVVINGINFAIAGTPIVKYKMKGTLKVTELSVVKYNNQNVEVFLPQLEYGSYIISVTNGNGTEAYADFIIYKTEQEITFSTGNSQCYTKPYLQLNYDKNGPSGSYGDTMRITPPNPDITYYQVITLYNSNFNTTTGGLVRLNSIQLITGDKVWLSNQSNVNENGIWIVTASAWIFITAVDEDVFVDLGAKAYDKKQGELTRQILTDVDINFSKPGAYRITYYIMNSQGVLSSIIRRLEILALGASINPTNSYTITDYQITPEFDTSLTAIGSTDDSCNNFCEPGDGNNANNNNDNCDCDNYILTDGSRDFNNNQSMGNNRITDLAPGQVSTDAVNLSQLLNVAQNLNSIRSSDLPTFGVINALSVVYVGDDGLLHAANSSDLNTINRVIGITTVTSNEHNRTSVVHNGVMNGFTGLSQGSFYFFDTNGTLIKLAPSNGYSQVVGIAINSSTLIVQIQIPVVLP